MTEREQRQLVSRALDIGERMLLCGGEVSRVEDTIYRILKSYGASRVEVFTILSFMSLTAVFDGETVLTENRRVSIVAYSNDFTRMEQLNALSREVCATLPGLPVLEEKLAAIDLPPRKKQFRELYLLLGYILSGTGFALFFGGSWRDALGAGLCCLAVWFLNWFLKRAALQRLFHAFFVSFIAGALCYLMILLGLGEHPGQVMMAVIMVLIPGIAITNAMREMLISDTISGILRLVESLLIATAVAFGFALAMFVFKDHFPEEHFTSLDAEPPAAGAGRGGGHAGLCHPLQQPAPAIVHRRPGRRAHLAGVPHLGPVRGPGLPLRGGGGSLRRGVCGDHGPGVQGPGHGVHHPLRDRPDPRREPVYHHAPFGGRPPDPGPAVRHAHADGGRGHRPGHRPRHGLHHQLLLQKEAPHHGPQALSRHKRLPFPRPERPAFPLTNAPAEAIITMLHLCL